MTDEHSKQQGRGLNRNQQSLAIWFWTYTWNSCSSFKQELVTKWQCATCMPKVKIWIAPLGLLDIGYPLCSKEKKCLTALAANLCKVQGASMSEESQYVTNHMTHMGQHILRSQPGNLETRALQSFSRSYQQHGHFIYGSYSTTVSPWPWSKWKK